MNSFWTECVRNWPHGKQAPFPWQGGLSLLNQSWLPFQYTRCNPNIFQPTSKDKGGLNIRSARDNNTAMLTKLGWRLLSNDQAMWCKALRQKYMKDGNFWTKTTKGDFSHTWRSILKCREALRGGIHWSIGDGTQTSFWFHPWINGKAIIEISPQVVILPQATSWTVADFLTDTKTWDKPLLEAWLPNNIVEQILRVPIPISALARDGPIWKLTANGAFTTTSAHQYIQGVSNPLSDFNPHLLNNNNLTWNWIFVCRMWIYVGIMAAHNSRLPLRSGCLEKHWNGQQLLGGRRRNVAQDESNPAP